MTNLYVNNYITHAFSIIAFKLSTSLIHNIFKRHQFDYKGVPGQVLIT